MGVVDLLAGRAVHARGGTRGNYRPVQKVASTSIEPGDAVAMAQTYANLGITEMYVADLNAILGREPQDEAVGALAKSGLPCWLDAAASSVNAARHALDLGASRVIVGLETLPSLQTLDDICTALGKGRVAFSLDIRNGEPVRSFGSTATVQSIATRAAQAGVGALVVLDLARVGSGAGFDLELLVRVRAAAPSVTLLAGGGLSGLDDVRSLAEIGCDGALVATAVHDGRFTAHDIATASRLRPRTAIANPT